MFIPVKIRIWRCTQSVQAMRRPVINSRLPSPDQLPVEERIEIGTGVDDKIRRIADRSRIRSVDFGRTLSHEFGAEAMPPDDGVVSEFLPHTMRHCRTVAGPVDYRVNSCAALPKLRTAGPPQAACFGTDPRPIYPCRLGSRAGDVCFVRRRFERRRRGLDLPR